ncbi:MAG: 3-oxoacyl-ACP reductase family protein [Planctomycetota bacterium]|jgi:NAD(P)-dependent dehydrogenase (short-subunit alcohol dehydrogenase family)
MLKDKVAFVTGGSGAVGRAIVKALGREGARVAYSYKSGLETAKQLDKELTASGIDVRSYHLDIVNGKACIELAKRIENEFGLVDILVNNAGATQVMPFAMIEEKDWDLVMDVNVKGMFLVTKAFARGMIRRKVGNIINIGSLAGMRMLEVPVHYAAAKSAVAGFTLSLARELGRYNIRVNTVVPGMLTDGVSVNVPVKQQEQYKNYCALSRAGRPEEVAELVAFLASDRSSYINAQSISVDGGI